MEVREWTWFDIPEYEGTPEGAERITRIPAMKSASCIFPMWNTPKWTAFT